MPRLPNITVNPHQLRRAAEFLREDAAGEADNKNDECACDLESVAMFCEHAALLIDFPPH